MASVPKGCDPSINSIYYNLCDLTIVWGVAVEAVAAAGVVTSFVLFIVLMASLPFVTDKKRKEICSLTQQDPDQEQPDDGDHVYPARSLVYDNILKEPEPPHQNVYMENKAFSMDEPPAVTTKPVSPYGAYNGQLRSCVYQPTEIALIAKGLTKMEQDTMLPRARTPSLNPGSGSPLPPSTESLPT